MAEGAKHVRLTTGERLGLGNGVRVRSGVAVRPPWESPVRSACGAPAVEHLHPHESDHRDMCPAAESSLSMSEPTRAMRVLADVADRVHTLPAIPIMGWADRAAELLAAVTEVPGTVVALALMSGPASAPRLDAVGVARSAAGGPMPGIHKIEAVRTAVEALDGPALSRMLDARGGDVPSSVLQALAGVPTAEPVLASLTQSSDRHAAALVSVPSGHSIGEAAASIATTVLPLLLRRARVALGEPPAGSHGWITSMEETVLAQLVVGKSVRQIADELGRSPHTVHDHVKSLHRKLNASSRGELIARALGHVTNATRIRAQSREK